MKLSLNLQILVGALLGIVLGFFLNVSGTSAQPAAGILYSCDLIGSVFINLLKMILIPIVFVSIAVGIANLRRHAQMNFVWKLSLTYLIGTMFIAATLGLIVANVTDLGKGLNITAFSADMSQFKAASVSLPQFAKHFISQLFLNPIAAMAQGQVLPTIVFAAFLGIALIAAGERAKTVLNLLNEMFELIMIMIGWIMRLLPFGILVLLAKLIATQDVQILGTLFKFMLIVGGITLFHGLVVLPSILFAATGYSPIKFFVNAREALITALSTSSSNATLPITLRVTRENFKVDRDVAGFVVPLGATINMDGTAMYEALAAIFVANLVGVELTLLQQVVVVLTAVIAALGAPGIPSAGMVTMVMVLQSVGLPVEAIAILLPIDRPLDTLRTMVNVEGDMIGSIIVDHHLKKRS